MIPWAANLKIILPYSQDSGIFFSNLTIVLLIFMLLGREV